MKIAILGSGDLARQISHYAETDLNYSVVGYFDDFLERDTKINGKTILGSIESVLDFFSSNLFDALVVGVGYNHLNFRADVFNRFQGIIPFKNIIHPSCLIDSRSIIGEGVVIFPGSILDMNSIIGDNVLLNIDCAIAHDTKIGNHCFLSPSVKIAGFCDIGEKCVLGINTVIIDSKTITHEVHTGGGTIIIKDINRKGLYVGNPQRFIR